MSQVINILTPPGTTAEYQFDAVQLDSTAASTVKAAGTLSLSGATLSSMKGTGDSSSVTFDTVATSTVTTTPFTVICVQASALSAGSSPTATACIESTGFNFQFGIPSGAQGATGLQGPQGPKGDTGATPTITSALINAVGLVNNATTGNSGSTTKLQTTRYIRTNLSTTAGVYFDGITDIYPGIQGILPIGYGGTGATSATSALTNLGMHLYYYSTVTSKTSIASLTGSYNGYFLIVPYRDTFGCYMYNTSGSEIGTYGAANGCNPFMIYKTYSSTSSVTIYLNSTSFNIGYLQSVIVYRYI